MNYSQWFFVMAFVNAGMLPIVNNAFFFALFGTLMLGNLVMGYLARGCKNE